MEPQHTITVRGRTIPTFHVRILTPSDPLPDFYSELTGPESAFEVEQGPWYDTVRVVSPELVTIQTFQAL